jgi:hypothetical protein
VWVEADPLEAVFTHLCLVACAVTGLWAECGGNVGIQGAKREQFHGDC